jgi:hypothetical protein
MHNIKKKQKNAAEHKTTGVHNGVHNKMQDNVIQHSTIKDKPTQ